MVLVQWCKIWQKGKPEWSELGEPFSFTVFQLKEFSQKWCEKSNGNPVRSGPSTLLSFSSLILGIEVGTADVLLEGHATSFPKRTIEDCVTSQETSITRTAIAIYWHRITYNCIRFNNFIVFFFSKEKVISACQAFLYWLFSIMQRIPVVSRRHRSRSGARQVTVLHMACHLSDTGLCLCSPMLVANWI